MVYCQHCGASNAEDARFCNMCGTKIAESGEPGGPLDPNEPAPTLFGHSGGEKDGAERPARREAATEPDHEDERAPSDRAPSDRAPSDRARSDPPRRKRERASSGDGGIDKTPPPQSFDISTVSLSAIGVRSRGTAWGVILLIALLFVGLGAGGMWVALHADSGPAVAQNDDPIPTDPVEPEEIELGDPVPEGEEPPVDFVPGTPEPTGRSGRASSGRTTSTPASGRRGSSGGSSAGTSSGRSGSSGTSGGTPSSGSSGGTSSSGTSSGGSSGGTSSSGTSSSGSSGGTSSSGSSGGTSSGGTSGGSVSGAGTTVPDWDNEEIPEERDLEMDMYATRVRSVIRTYYILRACCCCENET
ncbi:MAG: zinc ribbon domain-containing protein, partial [Sandaracinaceae bacterium]